MWRSRSIEQYISKISPLFRMKRLHDSLNCTVDENWALLGYHAASSGNSLPTFRDKVSVPQGKDSSWTLTVQDPSKPGRATPRAVIHWPVTTATKTRTEGCLCGICGGHNGIGSSFKRVLCLLSVSNTQQTLQAHIFVHLILTMCNIWNWKYPQTKHILLPPHS
jgi:hypothetical protein